MSRSLRSIVVATALLASIAPSARAQNFFGQPGLVAGIDGRRYSFEDGFPVKSIQQWAFPIGVIVPVGARFSFDIGTHYVSTRVTSASGSHDTFNGLTDTQLRASYVFGRDFLVTSLMINLPTGKEQTSGRDFTVASSVSSNFLLFPVNNYGSGTSATGGVAIATPIGRWNLGLAGSLRVNAAYKPFSDASSSSIEYKPGVETRLRVGADRLVGQSRLAFGFTFSTFGDDHFTGTGTSAGAYNPGNRFITEANFTTPAGSGLISLYAWDYYRSSSGSNSGLAASNKENIITGGISGAFPVAAKIRIEPLAEARFWSPDGGSGSLFGAGAAVRFEVTPQLSFAPGGRFDLGSIEVPGASSSSLTGWGLTGLLRYTF